MSFDEGTNFTEKRRKSEIATVGSIYNKVANYLVSGETCEDLDSHADKIIHGKGFMEIYNLNLPVKVSG